MKLAFTGHRPDKLGGYADDNPTRLLIGRRVRRLLLDLQPEMVYSGLALGLDTWVAEVCNFLHQPWTACIPFEGQDSLWPQVSRLRYQYLRERATRVIVLSPGGYAPQKMQKRNKFMVDRSDLLVAFWDGTPGGTANCVAYAQRIGRRLLRAAPPEWVPLAA